MRSSAVLERTVKNLNLRNVWGKKYNNGDPLNVADAVAILKTRLDISVLELRQAGGRVMPGQTWKASSPVAVARSLRAAAAPVRICAFSDNATEAALLANGVAESYRDFRRESRQASAAPIEREVTILDAAVPDFRAVRPNKPLNYVVGALAGLLIGVITAPIVLGIIASIREGRNAATVPQKA
jgi:uncharacterized protein involved in exopolysaccharide biosynthesis